MNPTDVLVDEHRLIEQVLNCLERMAEQGTRPGAVDREPVNDAITFFHTFVERWHFPREEAYLRAATEMVGEERARAYGPPFHEHGQCRAHLRGMQQAARSASSADAAALSQFAGHARAYIDILMEHIENEEDHIFAAIGASSLAEKKAQAAEAFRLAASGCAGPQEVDACVQTANRLADRYGVSRADLSHLSKPA
jgi:hemerythrin-like domain-containing protein